MKIFPSFIFNIRHEYRANVVAQSVCFIINCVLYYVTDDMIFTWIAIATISFIGVVTSQPKHNILDRNLLNHLLVVILYYIFSDISFNFHLAYFGLIFIFTYVFFILKDSVSASVSTRVISVSSVLEATCAFLEFR